jgi:hypothetical protein
MGRRRRRGDASRAPADLGLRLRRGEPADCGLCGQTMPLTRTHVPPQCAGNTQGVQRHYLQTVTADGVPTVVRARKSWAGGLYVYGLCAQCNSNAGRWDGAYGALATALRPCWSSGALATPGGRIGLPSYAFSPSAVARSVIMGMFGVNRGLRARHPSLAQGLLDAAEPLALPPDLRLRVALAKGTTARLTGAVHTVQVLGPTATGGQSFLYSDASFYFPPLAWQLAGNGSTLLDEQGWDDATAWLAVALTDTADIATLCPSLPTVTDPTHDSAIADSLVHVFSDELTPIVECVGLSL